MSVDPLVPVALIVGFVVLVGVIAIGRRRRGAGRWALARFVAAGLLAAAVVANPTVAGGRAEARESAADVLFVVDTTASMAAEDYAGDRPRLDGVRADIAEIAAAFPGAHFSLVRFDSQARIDVPWTTDVAAIETAALVLRPERAVYSTGTEPDRALDLIDRQLPRPESLEDGADSGSSHMDAADDDRYTVVFYLSDGERTAPASGADQPSLTQLTADVLGEATADGGDEATFAGLGTQIDAGAVLGYGTAEGAPMLQFVGPHDPETITDDGYVIDHTTGERAISRFDEAALRAIADELGVEFVHRTEPGGLGPLARGIAAAGSFHDAGARGAREPLYWIPAVGLAFLAALECAGAARELAATRGLFAARRPAAPPPAPARGRTRRGRRREDPGRVRSPRPARRRIRRIVLVVPLALALFATGARFTTMYWFSAAGTAAYDAGHHASAESWFSRLGPLGPLDPWRADLGTGAATYRRGDLVAAETAFAAALAAAPGRCDLRFNLVVTVEAEGDRLLAGRALAPTDGSFSAVDVTADPDAALGRYRHALAVIDAGNCVVGEPGDAAARLAETRERIAAKVDALDSGDRGGREVQRLDDALENQRGDSEQIDQLNTRNESGAAQREASRNQNTNGRIPNDQSNW